VAEHPAVVFLLAAHQQAEELARAATPGPWEPEGDDPTDDEAYTVHDGEHGDLVGNPVAYVRDGMWGRRGEGCTQANMRLIAGHADPVAVLRRVAADRQILAEHADDCGDCRVCCDAGLTEYVHDYGVVEMRSGESFPCRTVLLLAQAWGWEDGQHG